MNISSGSDSGVEYLECLGTLLLDGNVPYRELILPGPALATTILDLDLRGCS